jgi:tripartite-type tricarboxylate transporter receptor subunit TctC
MQHKGTLAMIAGLALATSGPALAQPAKTPFSGKPVTVIAPYDPGGPIDIEARIFTRKSNELTSQQYIIEYKPGAATRIGVAYVAKAAPDGHTLLFTTGGFAILPVVFKNLAFDSIKDFAPVAQMSQQFTVFIVRPSFPAKNFAEYLTYAKANPGKVSYGMLGSGSSGHLAGAWLEGATNTKVNFIPYKGTGPAMLDVTAERLDVLTAGLIAAMPHIKSGKMRPLAVMNALRSKLLPDVPTIAEQGVPSYGYTNWTGFFAPRATPTAAIARHAEDFGAVARSRDVIDTLEAQGSVPIGNTPAQFSQALATDIARWHKIVQDNGIKVED